MATFADRLAARMPAGSALPEPLVRSINFMESSGWMVTDDDGAVVCVTPYPGDRQLGPVFRADLTVDGWLNPEAPGAERVVPIAETDGSGGVAAIWIDDDGAPRYIGFSSDGAGALRLADTTVDFLRLLAVGYDEFEEFNFGEAPEVEPDRDPVSAVAEFRTWVESEFGVTVPAQWEVTEDDAYATWVEPILAEHGISAH